MGELIPVDFVNKMVRDQSVATFIEILQNYLSAEDYEDFVVAINDPTYANSLSPDMNRIVNEYWALMSRHL